MHDFFGIFLRDCMHLTRSCQSELPQPRTARGNRSWPPVIVISASFPPFPLFSQPQFITPFKPIEGHSLQAIAKCDQRLDSLTARDPLPEFLRFMRIHCFQVMTHVYIYMISFHLSFWDVQGLAKRLRPGLVNYIAAVAYHFCLSLPTAFSQPGRSLLAGPCILDL